MAKRKNSLLKKQSVKQTPGPRGVTRREFIGYTAGIGMLPLLHAHERDRDSEWGRHSDRPRRSTERRTLFFNLAHEDFGKTRYFLMAGGRRYQLRKVSRGRGARVLRKARRKNRFLQNVPDSAITHVLINATFATNSVTLCYLPSNINMSTGTWSMSGMHFHIPQQAFSFAYQRARELTPDGPLPLSAKREMYGHAAAESLQDLMDEQALVDCTSHAATLVGLHPALLSGEPNSAAHVQCNYIGNNRALFELTSKLMAAGPATPQVTPGVPNAQGWATLEPLLDTGTNQPIVNQKGTHKGLVQYYPQWDSMNVAPAAKEIMLTVQPQVNTDTTLGADITDAVPDGNPNESLTGKLWFRNDGFTTVDQSSVPDSVSTSEAVTWILKNVNTESGLKFKVDVMPQPGGSTQVKATFSNWYLRYLSAWLQFLDVQGKVIDLSKVAGYPGGIISGHNAGDDTDNAIFATIVGPVFTTLGYPVSGTDESVTFTVPANVDTVRFVAGGIGASGSNYDQALENFGIVLTVLINFAITVFMLAAGASDRVGAFLEGIAVFTEELAIAILPSFETNNQTDYTGDFWSIAGKNLLENIFSVGVEPPVTKMIAVLNATIAESIVEDSMPVVGQVLQAIAAVAGLFSLAETVAEVSLSPPSYIYDLIGTHDLSVTIKPDPENNTFPKAATTYKVTALITGSTPHVQTLKVPQPVPSTLPPVVFKNFPLGGMVNVSVAFCQATSPGQLDVLLGKGSTGLVPNTATDPIPAITLEQIKFPISSETVYQHKQVTALDSSGNHLWNTQLPQPTSTATSCENGLGDLCELRGITVRQGTSSNPGYVGYAWQGFSGSLQECTVGGSAQLDLLANLNTGNPAQTGYATIPCGLEQGARLSYSLLSSGPTNFYLDSTNQVLRQVGLGAVPAFDDPTGMMAWGALNFTSTALLLHPAGKFVSINNPNHRMEILDVPPAPMTDAEAKVKLLASVRSGPGQRPGLMTNPVAAAISPEGVILVLEGGANNRLQAFDVGGNSVPFFTKQSAPYFLELTATAGGVQVYLDLAVEFTGYIYVLSMDNNTNRYRMDIYHPEQIGTAPISTTQAVNAGALSVDFWRNVYTLNYEVLKLPDGSFPMITEPSVSLWVPNDSCTGVGCSP